MTPWRQKETVTVKEAALIIGVSEDTIRRRLEDGKIKSIQFRSYQRILIPTSEVLRVLTDTR